MLVFVLIIIGLALLAQKFVFANSLDGIQEELYPEAPLAEPGEPFCLHLTLTNTRRRYVPFLRLVLHLPEGVMPLDKTRWGTQIGVSGGTLTYSTWLKPRQQLELRIPIEIAQRGRYILNRLTLSGGDFLGLKEQSRPLDRFVEVVVPPKEAPTQPIAASTGSLLGNLSVTRFIHEDPILTVGFREYTGREPMKQISWTQSARGHGIMVKSFDYSTEPVVSVLLNAHTKSYGQEENLEACFSMTRSVCQLLEDRNIPYDLYSNVALAGGWSDQERLVIHRGLGSSHFQRVAELLGRATYLSTSNGNTFLKRNLDRTTAHGCILVTTADGMPEQQLLHRLQESSGGNLLLLTPESILSEGNP